MFLYERNKTNIDIYFLEANKKKLIDYRKKIIDKSSVIDLFYCFETNHKTLMDKFIKGERIDNQILNNDKEYYSKFNKIFLEKRGSFGYNYGRHVALLQDYIDGNYSKSLIANLSCYDCKNKNSDSHFLALSKPKKVCLNDENKYLYKLESILRIPKDLYFLHLIENAKFEELLLLDDNITDQLNLFNLNKIDSLDLDKIRKAVAFDLLTEKEEDLTKKINTSQKILRKIK